MQILAIGIDMNANQNGKAAAVIVSPVYDPLPDTANRQEHMLFFIQVKVGSEGATAGASAGPETGAQAKISYHKCMAVFVHTKGGLMYEASIGGQKFGFKPNGQKSFVA